MPADMDALIGPGDLTHVIADTDEPVAPCGACRQVMMKLGYGSLVVVQTNLRGAITETTAAALLPDAFALNGG
jgi:cytidine deaminase